MKTTKTTLDFTSTPDVPSTWCYDEQTVCLYRFDTTILRWWPSEVLG
jgi:hypothetical protein